MPASASGPSWYATRRRLVTVAAGVGFVAGCAGSTATVNAPVGNVAAGQLTIGGRIHEFRARTCSADPSAVIILGTGMIGGEKFTVSARSPDSLEVKYGTHDEFAEGDPTRPEYRTAKPGRLVGDGLRVYAELTVLDANGVDADAHLAVLEVTCAPQAQTR